MKAALIPIAFGLAVLLGWEWAVRAFAVKAFILPAPSVIAAAFWRDRAGFAESLAFTARITGEAFLLATTLGLGAAILFTRSKTLSRAIYPFAVILQVTPIVSIAPLVVIWVGIDEVERALLILATIVAFFPILSNAVLGLRSVDFQLKDLMRLYGASDFEILWKLELPSAAPQILAGMKIAGGLALIGAVVAEFVAGSGGATGLAWRIVEAGNRLEIPAMFAGLALLSATGIAIFLCLSGLEWLILHSWHESARAPE